MIHQLEKSSPQMSLNKLQQQLKKKEKERKESAKEKKPLSDEAKRKIQADSAAFQCQVCRQTFMVTAKRQALLEHAENKHPKVAPGDCFFCLKEGDS